MKLTADAPVAKDEVARARLDHHLAVLERELDLVVRFVDGQDPALDNLRVHVLTRAVYHLPDLERPLDGLALQPQRAPGLIRFGVAVVVFDIAGAVVIHGLHGAGEEVVALAVARFDPHAHGELDHLGQAAIERAALVQEGARGDRREV
eukprot:CAMPEP_0182543832 /NCGR_PEP_ID=MMETSP1323-20130603/32225_1 /TAXON_ID=236787 /ORGANISM="Florenciella parvula, Strain RCC1693" /LENGTH=148 /DNA_ID=CAMNT_0024754805 /DNA_START=48 /DNA_END=495 /DNA_ORIENTATION=+